MILLSHQKKKADISFLSGEITYPYGTDNFQANLQTFYKDKLISPQSRLGGPSHSDNVVMITISSGSVGAHEKINNVNSNKYCTWFRYFNK